LIPVDTQPRSLHACNVSSQYAQTNCDVTVPHGGTGKDGTLIQTKYTQINIETNISFTNQYKTKFKQMNEDIKRNINIKISNKHK
jgi:hypothetical protein